jgi:hypothetical protein
MYCDWTTVFQRPSTIPPDTQDAVKEASSVSKELLEPPDEKAIAQAPVKEPLQLPTLEAEPAAKKPIAVPSKGWRRLSRGQYLAGGGIVIATLLAIVLLVVALGAPAKTSTPTTNPQVKQVVVPPTRPMMLNRKRRRRAAR